MFSVNFSLSACRYIDPDMKFFLQECSLLDPRFRELSFLTEEEKLRVSNFVTAMVAHQVEAVDLITGVPASAPKKSEGILLCILSLLLLCLPCLVCCSLI